MALEEEFSEGDTTIEISDEDAEAINTVNDVLSFLKSKGISD